MLQTHDILMSHMFVCFFIKLIYSSLETDLSAVFFH